jgi:hypothetical protein
MAIKHLSRKIVVALIYLTLGIGSYAAAWKTLNHPIEIKDVEISSIDRSVGIAQYAPNGPNGPMEYIEVTIPGYDTHIDFTSRNWDGTVEEGDLVDITFQKQFLGGLEGITVDDHK